METIENLISGLFISFQSIGEAIGPIISSFLTENFGFRTSQEIFCFMLFTFWFTYFLLCGNFEMCKGHSSRGDQENEAQMQDKKGNSEI